MAILSSDCPTLLSSRRRFLEVSALAFATFASPTAAQANRVQRPPFWSVRKDGKTIYILGESLPRPLDWSGPAVERVLLDCGHLWTKTNQIYRRPAGKLVEAFGASHTATPLDLLTSTQRKRLEQAANAAKLSLADLSGMRPWLIGASLEDAGYQAAGFTGKSANAILSAEAVRASIPVSSEFAVKDDVFAWFGSFSPTQEAQFLNYVLDGVLLGRSGSERISRSWLSGQPAPAAAFVAHERRAYPDLYRKLTADRNSGWIPRFEVMLRNPKPAMVVVGLYHLVGPDNLLIQLEKAGFRVSSENVRSHREFR